jgi:WD40 repeat protein
MTSPNAVRIWDLTTNQEERTLRGQNGTTYWPVFNPDGSRLATPCSDGTIRIWDVTINPEAPFFKAYAAGALTVAFSPDESRLASAANDRKTVEVWNATTGQLLHTLQGHTGRVCKVTFSPDGRRLASASEDKTARVWDTATGQLLRTFTGHTSEVASVAFSPNGERIASASGHWTGQDKPGEVLIWSASTGQVALALKAHSRGIHWKALAFSPDGARLATGSYDQTIKIWDTATGQLLRTLEGHTYVISSVAFSPDGRLLASSSRDKTVKIWDTTRGREIRNLGGHPETVNDAKFSPDGTRIFSSDGGFAVKVWDVESGLEAFSTRYTGSISSLALSPDGTRLAGAATDGTLMIWNARPWTPEAAIEREALGLLGFFFAKPLRKNDVIEYLRYTPTCRPEVRQRALALVERYHDETDPERYHRAAWAIVRQGYLNPVQYRFALRQAETAHALASKAVQYLTTLGAAQYRAGRHSDALGTLTQADQLSAGNPTTLAFLAMTQHRLGQEEQAQASLTRLRETVNKEEWAKNDEPQALLREAERLLGSNQRVSPE